MFSVCVCVCVCVCVTSGSHYVTLTSAGNRVGVSDELLLPCVCLSVCLLMLVCLFTLVNTLQAHSVFTMYQQMCFSHIYIPLNVRPWLQ